MPCSFFLLFSDKIKQKILFISFLVLLCSKSLFQDFLLIINQIDHEVSENQCLNCTGSNLSSLYKYFVIIEGHIALMIDLGVLGFILGFHEVDLENTCLETTNLLQFNLFQPWYRRCKFLSILPSRFRIMIELFFLSWPWFIHNEVHKQNIKNKPIYSWVNFLCIASVLYHEWITVMMGKKTQSLFVQSHICDQAIVSRQCDCMII